MAKHNTKDANAPLLVDHVAQKVTIPPNQRTFGTVGDHRSEQITFQIPKSIDNHDMLTCDRAYVTWKNSDGVIGHDDLTLDDTDDEFGYFCWLIRDALTVARGVVQFSLHFECFNDAGTRTYSWGTTTCSDGEILDSINAYLGSYAAIYVDEETLIFSDYTPVLDKAVELTSCVAPTGTLNITENGKHDVGPYAYVNVNPNFEAPVVSVTGSGVITAEANGQTTRVQLAGSVITNLRAANIKKGIQIIDVVGTYDPIEGTAPTVVIENGVVQATANGQTTQKQLAAADVPGLTPDVIASGETVLDVTGTYKTPVDINVPFLYTVRDSSFGRATFRAAWSYLVDPTNKSLYYMTSTYLSSSSFLYKVAKNSIVLFTPIGVGDSVGKLSINRDNVVGMEPIGASFGSNGYMYPTSTVAFRITGDAPSIEMMLLDD
jgi:hypothetical protein